MRGLDISVIDQFDHAPRFEKIQSRKIFRDEITESDHPIEDTEPQIKLKYIRRQVITPDAVAIQTTLRESGGDLPNSVEIRRNFGITPVSPSIIAKLYKNCFDSSAAYKDVRRFNKQIDRIERRCNLEHTRVIAQLGAVGVFGDPHDPEKKKYIGAEIVEGSDEGVLDAEHEQCLSVLTDGNQAMRSKYYEARKTHLSLAYTYSYMDALQAVDYLNQEKPLRNKWVTLGQAYTPSQSLHLPEKPQDS